jgi:predicted DsbA family dithiol-disulfide isomerase
MQQGGWTSFLSIQVGLLLVGMHGLWPSASAQPPVAVATAGARGPDSPAASEANLTPSEKASLRRLEQKFQSPCGKPHSLLTSLKSDPSCRLSAVAERWIVRLLLDGNLEEEIEQRYQRRFGGGKCEPIDIAGAQVLGPSDAPIALIEFSDFECPHCRAAEPLVRQVLKEFKDVRLVFMNYPLPIHPNAATAAAAALAAGRQGQFWPYHDKLMESTERLQQTTLIAYARALHLDLQRFQTDLEALRSRVARERAIGEKLALSGTPSFFVGCQKIEGPATIDTIRSYIEAEMAK